MSFPPNQRLSRSGAKVSINPDTIPAEALADAFSLAGSRESDQCCIRCGKTADLAHRLAWLECKEKCCLCDANAHKNSWCSRMKIFFPALFTREWFLERAGLGRWYIWEEEGVKIYQLVRDDGLRRLREREAAPSTASLLAAAVAAAAAAKRAPVLRFKASLDRALWGKRVEDKDEEMD
ncbi:hypothetical protein BCR34DRAFT_597110 [Clohesyomyces aquaticus]|uniref:Uncharacterized protein n=1 Tax=Clohesyomyces aquaticus TaxID=1231657 RepID=A0A1Y2A478_9PLEO|nr:hypothetical protein BCR34DRAFT_597110 [Clohesyomyces aquaticus]